MSASLLRQSAVLLLLVVSGVAARLVFAHIPNFAPVASIALFAGFYFRNPWVALCAPLLAMGVSDIWLGGYHWGVMLTVYLALALPALASRWLRDRLEKRHDTAAWKVGGGLFCCSLGSSLLFFGATNFAVWLFWSGAYAPTLSGLAACYLAALPFFRYTLAADLLFTMLLFGSYFSLQAWARQELRKRHPLDGVATPAARLS